jgi:type IV pilus assembly protein PilQ
LDFNLSAQSIKGINENGLPQLGKQIVKQQVNVQNMQTMVLVGFDRRYESEGISKVPVLGDLPLLGLLACCQ